MKKYLLIAALALFTTAAYAHSWYPQKCCSDQDCKPVACEDILQSNTDNSYIYDGHKFPYNSVYPSQDSKCHACIYEYTVGDKLHKVPFCLFIQMNT